MDILFLAQIIPYPPNAGPKVKTWNVIRYLAECGHRITFVSFVRPDELPYIPALKQVCEAVHVIPIKRVRLFEPWYLLKSLWNRRPYLVERDDRKELRDLVLRLLSEKQYDVIHADQVTMAQFADCLPEGKRRPDLIFDAHNAVWMILDRMAQKMPLIIRSLGKFEAQRMKKYEGELVHSFDHTMAVSEVDSHLLQEAVLAIGQKPDENKISVIPIAVDTLQLKKIHPQPGSLNLLTLGTLHYPPNADGIRWFVNEIFPLIKSRVPEVTLSIIGKNPPKDFVDLSIKDPRTFFVPGYVEDLTAWLEKAAVIVIPVQVGGGIRVRILEAFAHAMPVVTTEVGLEGIHARVGDDVLVADQPETFADCVVRVLEDHELAEKLAENGRKLAETRYDWKIVLRAVEKVYSAIDTRLE
jgi:polysaccharide biosynthesis protein PslH